MGALFRTQEEIEKNLTGQLMKPPVVTEGTVIPFHSGRRAGDKAMSPELKKLIGATAAVSGPTAAAKVFNVPHSTASQLAGGITSNINGVKRVNEDLKAHVTEKKDGISRRAVDLLFDTLGTVQVEEISALTVKERVGVAKDMANIVERVTPREQSIAAGTVVVLAPTMLSVDKFEILAP